MFSSTMLYQMILFCFGAKVESSWARSKSWIWLNSCCSGAVVPMQWPHLNERGHGIFWHSAVVSLNTAWIGLCCVVKQPADEWKSNCGTALGVFNLKIHTGELHLCLHFCLVSLVVQSFSGQLQHGGPSLPHGEWLSDSKNKDIQTLLLFQHWRHPEIESAFTPALSASVIFLPGAPSISWSRGYNVCTPAHTQWHLHSPLLYFST